MANSGKGFSLESETVLTTSLADEISFRLRRRILEGEYTPGTRLVQDDLCRLFGVSRTPIREALRKLQAQNLLEVIPNKGATVRGVSKKELQEIYQIRAELEGFCCELAAPRLSEEDYRALEDSQSKLAGAVREYEEQEIEPEREASFNVRVNRSNELFHGIIHKATSNERLRGLVKDLRRCCYPRDYIWQATGSAKQVFLELNCGEHDRIIQALRARDGREARQAMTDHVTHAGETLINFYDERDFWK